MDLNELSKIFLLRDKTSSRVSSWNRKGSNRDIITIGGHKTKTIAEIEGSGIINHIYFTTSLHHPLDFRAAVLKMYWDNEEKPSVEVPLGDFFGVCNCRIRPFNSIMITITPGATGYGYNAYFPMPFSEQAKIEIENQGSRPFGGYPRALWYHIDYDLIKEPWSSDVGYFHAYWNRENPTKISNNIPIDKKNLQEWTGRNLTGKDNYLILDIEGNGILAGLLLCVDNLVGGWYGEGDDMIFIDDDTWPPLIHGTGTEEIFGGGPCPQYEFSTPYSGFHLIENPDFSGNNGMYRWYFHDGIRFKKKIKWTIEHGHANNFENDYTSVAYWYQKEPHEFPAIPKLEHRIPRMPPNFEILWKDLSDVGLKAFGLREHLIKSGENIIELLYTSVQNYYEGKYELLENKIQKLRQILKKHDYL